MSEELPNHEELERVVHDAPRAVIGRLPNNTEGRRAADHIELAYRYAQESRERPADRS